jgi:ribosomal protein S27AE
MRDSSAGFDDAKTKKPPEDPIMYCPRCNNALAEFRCKLVCERCGYYMSCADYY